MPLTAEDKIEIDKTRESPKESEATIRVAQGYFDVYGYGDDRKVDLDNPEEGDISLRYGLAETRMV